MKKSTCYTTLLAAALCLTSGVATAVESKVNVTNGADMQRVRISIAPQSFIDSANRIFCTRDANQRLPTYIIPSDQDIPQGKTNVAIYDPTIQLSYSCKAVGMVEAFGYQESHASIIRKIEMSTKDSKGNFGAFSDLTTWHVEQSDTSKSYTGCLNQINSSGGGTMTITVGDDKNNNYNFIDVTC